MKELLLAALIATPLLANANWKKLSGSELSGWQTGKGGAELRNHVSGQAINKTSGNVWSHVEWQWQATNNSTTLSFHALGTSDRLGSSLDNIAVTSTVPAPVSHKHPHERRLRTPFFMAARPSPNQGCSPAQ